MRSVYVSLFSASCQGAEGKRRKRAGEQVMSPLYRLLSNLGEFDGAALVKGTGRGDAHHDSLQTGIPTDRWGLVVQNGIHDPPRLAHVSLGITFEEEIKRFGLVHTRSVHKKMIVGRVIGG